jgi:ABC-type dipeptide/oligopeptide/nickel transport system permease component
MIRLLVATALPFVVPGLITAIIWMLPGDPASIICPPELCGGTDILAKHWNLDSGPVHFYSEWVKGSFGGDFGASWRYQQGVPISELMDTALPNSALLLFLGLIPVSLGALAGGLQLVDKKWDTALVSSGIVPTIVLALLFSAMIVLKFGAGDSFEGPAYWYRLIGGALTLGFADAAFSGALIGFRDMVFQENRQRYAQISILRGETVLSNSLPNVLGALFGQYRGRILHLLSGLVVVEVVLGIDGIGSLLWGGTLLQDFGVVLAAAFGFALFSAFLLVVQALIEFATAMHIRRAPLLEAA